MILENFYTVKNSKKEENNSYSFEIKINKEHKIFEGHFPDNPIMPGVCMMQIIKEMTEGIVETKLFMEKCSNVKFMALINPEINPDLIIELIISEEDDKIKIRNITKFEETLALKLTAYYKKVKK